MADHDDDPRSRFNFLSRDSVLIARLFLRFLRTRVAFSPPLSAIYHPAKTYLGKRKKKKKEDKEQIIKEALLSNTKSIILRRLNDQTYILLYIYRSYLNLTFIYKEGLINISNLSDW